MKNAHKYQRGAALIALLAVLVLGTSWYLTSRLNAASGDFTAVTRNHNAKVLNQAKQVLIGWMVMNATSTADNNPGRLPCPEAYASIGGPNEGKEASFCALQWIGRLPWRTLGLDKLVDSAGEPLWYVVSPGWALPSSSNPFTIINSDSPGNLVVDGQANETVALIIAPGPAMNVQASPGCTARAQTRNPPGPFSANPTDYLECFDQATLQFRTTAPSTSFNDQVVRITVADVMPAIEAAIAQRIKREIVPLLRDIYIAPNFGLSGSDRVFPFAAPFADPNTANFSGTFGTTQGLLPFSYQGGCTAGSDPRCLPGFVSWRNWSTTSPSLSYAGAGVSVTNTCSYLGPNDLASCTGNYVGGATQITVSGIQNNLAMALRQIDPAATGSISYVDLTSLATGFSTPSPSLVLNSDGSVTVSVTASLPAPAGPAGAMFWISVPGNATVDHALLDTSLSTGWFVRNQWYKLVYYAISSGYTASAPAPRSCTAANCITVTNVTPAGAKHAILILAGRSVNGTVRPSDQRANYLELGNATADGSAALPFVRRPVNAAVTIPVASRFNDRVVVIDPNP